MAVSFRVALCRSRNVACEGLIRWKDPIRAFNPLMVVFVCCLFIVVCFR